jgi:hypothetical protein
MEKELLTCGKNEVVPAIHTFQDLVDELHTRT